MTRTNKVILWFGLMFAMLIYGAILTYTSDRTLIQPQITQETPKSPQNGDFAVLEAWLDKLVTYENCPPEGIIDSNGFRSYGAYCYQQATFADFMSRFAQICMPYAEENEWLNNLSDYHTQRCLTKNIILADKNAYEHWLTSTVIKKGLGKPPI